MQGSFLEDVQRLHIPSLVWGSTPAVSGRPSRALRRIAGHTFAGLLAFGGCIPTIMGIMPVEKLDLLLLGEFHACWFHGPMLEQCMEHAWIVAFLLVMRAC